MTETPKVGVFVCGCGQGISAVVDIAEVVNYVKTLDGVVHVANDRYYCNEQGRIDIKDDIKRHGLNRIVIAACTPKTYEPLFEAVISEAGLNKNLLQMANIREQCSWVHGQDPTAATAKAKDIIRMVVARALVVEPQVELEIDVEPSTLILGGGIAGMTAALNLANQGFNVYLVEKEPELGGMLTKLNKLYLTDQSVSEVIDPIIQTVKAHERITLLPFTKLKDVRGYIGNFEATVTKAKRARKRDARTLKVGTIIVATGADVLTPSRMYGYGKSEKVITHLELEQLMRDQALGQLNNVVMIQCVGAREEKGRTYCSRVCCMTAIKNAALIKEQQPEVGVFVLYRDLQTYGKENEDYLTRVRDQGVRFIEYTPDAPPEVDLVSDEQLVVKVTPPNLGEEVQIDTDLVVLSTPLIPYKTGKEIAQILGVPLSADGFFFDAHTKLRPADFPIDGIYVCGTAESPKSVDESIAQALAAASRAAIPMASKRITIRPIMASIIEDKCVGCKLCVELCPYEAHEILEEGIPRVIEALCQGCGICVAACPEFAITMKNYKDEMILAEIKAAFAR
jgi:heterodisulfide reductase subunit A